MAKGFVPGIRVWILGFCILLGYGAVGVRLVELHVDRRLAVVEEIQRGRYRTIELEPRRGDIFLSKNGLDSDTMELVATSHMYYEVGVDPALIDFNDMGRLPKVASLLGVPLSKVESSFGIQDGRIFRRTTKLGDRWKLLKKRVDEATYERLMALKVDGLYGNSSYTRVYPKDQLASHVVGLTRNDGLAVSGVENNFDFFLRGQKGWKEVELRGGREMAQFRRREAPAQDGLNVALSIDSFVQKAIEEELAWIGQTLKAKWASIIVSEPHSGFLLAMANYPSYNPNQYSEYDIGNLRNRAITDPVEPGSTFKIVAASGALEERLVETWSTFDCAADRIRTPSGYVARLPGDSHHNGVLSVEEIVAKSSNRGAAHLGVTLGEDAFYGYVKKFGFGEIAGLNIGQESRGMLQPVNRWSGLTITQMPMGHEIAATPLQIHYAMAAVANGGMLMRPQTVLRVFDSNGESDIEYGPIAKRRVISYDTARTMSELLERTASPDGTAESASISGYRIAGKTGTSQKFIDGAFSHTRHVGSFSGFFPAHDPQLVITVVVDEAQVPGVAYGSRVAAPSFKRVAEKLIPYYGIAIADESQGYALGRDHINLNQRN